ncbi:GtrA family protein [Sporosarcina gallistercoris]|uniref:GtrA family protein n=1 Tax=Sporosarcina gallistercoris TaxID=2762245 RepID=A0ABR8PJ19_9BACL|nr:GtrA family protein [Sporosarcina gallistercoris]MBD7908152.1 GtrA family protein [Sporosarcina gallistercoris]
MPKFEVREFITFAIVGVINTATYYGFYLAGLKGLGLAYMISHFSAVILSMIISFFLNSYVTYKVKPTLKKFLMYPLTQLVNIAVTAVLLYILVDGLHVNSSIAPLAALIVTVPVTFVVTGKVLKAA